MYRRTRGGHAMHSMALCLLGVVMLLARLAASEQAAEVYSFEFSDTAILVAVTVPRFRNGLRNAVSGIYRRASRGCNTVSLFAKILRRKGDLELLRDLITKAEGT